MKAKPIVPRSAATRDIEQAVTHYLEESGEELALAFIDALEAGFRRVGTHAAAGSPRYAAELDLPGLRFWPLKRFPYLIFYIERDGQIDVWRVLRGERDIPAWLRPEG